MGKRYALNPYSGGMDFFFLTLVAFTLLLALPRKDFEDALYPKASARGERRP